MLRLTTLHLLRWFGALACAGAVTAFAQIPLVAVTETKGVGALAGTSFKNGYRMAVDEINGSGGVLGQKLVLTQFDIDTKPEAAKEAMIQAVASKPFAILGPIFSGLTLASMPVTEFSGIPHITGGEAASLTRKFHPTLLRTSLSQAAASPRLASFAIFGIRPKRLAIVSTENEFGREGKAAFGDVIRRQKVNLVVDAVVQPGQTDFSKVVTDLIHGQPDALLLYANESESIGVIKELRRQAFDKPIFTDGLVVSQTVIDSLGMGVEGVLAHVSTSVDAPTPQVQAFRARYVAKYGAEPDHNSMKGYFAVQLIKVGLELCGRVDSAQFMKTVKNARLDVNAYPNLLTTTGYDFFGELDRESYYVIVRGGRPRVLANTLRSTGAAMVELPDHRPIAMNSAEFRRLVLQALTTATSGSVNENPSRSKHSQ